LRFFEIVWLFSTRAFIIFFLEKKTDISSLDICFPSLSPSTLRKTRDIDYFIVELRKTIDFFTSMSSTNTVDDGSDAAEDVFVPFFV
jgi:hypothetical protein